MAAITEPSSMAPTPSEAGQQTHRVVAAVFVGIENDAADVIRTLTAISRASMVPQRIVVLDASAEGVIIPKGTTPVRVESVQLDSDLTMHQAYSGLTLGQLVNADLLWLVPAGVTPQPRALEKLVYSFRQSDSTRIVGPKVATDIGDEADLISVGLVATRSGRLIDDPEPGTPDQGQYNSRRDMLAVQLAGMLIDIDTWRLLGGYRGAFTGTAADLDFGWRAQLAGQRVVVQPQALVTMPLPVEDDEDVRRQARQVAVVRSSWWTAPFLATWILLSSIASAAFLLVAKRPAAARAEFRDGTAMLQPRQIWGERSKSRGDDHRAQGHLSSLFARSGRARGSVADQAYEHTTLSELVAPEVPESGPTSDESEAISDSRRSRFLTNPGLWSVIALTVASVVALRQVAAPVRALRSGLVGGEALPGMVSSQTLLQGWWDSWNGPGGGPAALMLGVVAWLAEHAPVLNVTNPGGAATSAIVVLAPAAAAWSSYLAARVVTTSRGVRGLVALGYAAGPATWVAVSQARIGALMLLVLAPIVLALMGRIASGSSTISTAAGLALALAGVTAFLPYVGIGGAVIGAVLAAVAWRRGGARMLVALTGWLALVGWWLVSLASHPVDYFAGPGLLAIGSSVPSPWQVLTLNLSGAGGVIAWAAVPVMVVAGLALARAGSRGSAQWGLGVLLVFSLAGTLLLPRLTVGVVGAGLPDAGMPIRPWWGVGVGVVWLVVCAVILVGLSDVPRSVRSAGPIALLRIPLVAVTAVGFLIAPTLAGWQGTGAGLAGWVDPRPAIAVDQSGAPLANRTVLLDQSSDGKHIAASVMDGDRMVLARESASSQRFDRDSMAAISALVDTSETKTLQARLSASAIGFVGLSEQLDEQYASRLDAAAGLTKMGSRDGHAFWRVDPLPAPAGNSSLGVGRVTVTSDAGELAVPVNGAFARTNAAVPSAPGQRLHIAMPRGIDDLTVAVDGVAVKPTGAGSDFELNNATSTGATHRVVIEVAQNPVRRWLPAVALVVLAFLLLPTTRRKS